MTEYKIYKIINCINNKVYVGKTTLSLKNRLCSHKSPKSSGCRKLFDAFNEYNRNNFIIELIVSCDDSDIADCLEKFWITVYDSIENGYNSREGGKHGKMSKETRNKMSNSAVGGINAVGHKVPKELINKIILANKKRTGIPNLFLKNKTWKVINGKRVWMEK